MSVLVAGGGISGLAAALELARAGVPVEIVEASARLGGKVATDRIDGFIIERGPDAMLTTRPAAVALARDVGLGGDLIGVNEPRTVEILREGRPIPMPEGVGLVLPTKLRPFLVTRLFSWPEKARMALDLVLPRAASPADEPVGAYLERRLGRALVDRLAGPLVGGIYGMSIDEISLDAAVPGLREAERAHRSLLLAGLADGRRMRAAAGRPRTEAGAPRPPGIFASLAGGLGTLVDATARALGATGIVHVALGVEVRSLGQDATSIRASLSDGRTVRCDAVIVAIEGPAAARLLEGVAPAAASAIASIPHGSCAVVSLGYRTDRFPIAPTSHGLLIPASEGYPISAITWSSNKWAHRAPDGGILARAYFLDPAARSSEDLVRDARAALERLAGVRGGPEVIRVTTYPGLMPRYTVGHLERIARVEAGLAATPRLAVAGAPFRGVGLPDCIAGGRRAAARVMAVLGVAEQVTSSRIVA